MPVCIGSLPNLLAIQVDSADAVYCEDQVYAGMGAQESAGECKGFSEFPRLRRGPSEPFLVESAAQASLGMWWRRGPGSMPCKPRHVVEMGSTQHAMQGVYLPLQRIINSACFIKIGQRVGWQRDVLERVVLK